MLFSFFFRKRRELGSVTLEEIVVRIETTKIILRKAFCTALEKTKIPIRKAGGKKKKRDYMNFFFIRKEAILAEWAKRSGGSISKRARESCSSTKA